MNKTNSENRHLVFLIFKKKQENDEVGDQTNVFGIKTKYHSQEQKMSFFGVCFIFNILLMQLHPRLIIYLHIYTLSSVHYYISVTPAVVMFK